MDQSTRTAESQARKQLVRFLVLLVWCSWGEKTLQSELHVGSNQYYFLMPLMAWPGYELLTFCTLSRHSTTVAMATVLAVYRLLYSVMLLYSRSCSLIRACVILLYLPMTGRSDHDRFSGALVFTGRPYCFRGKCIIFCQ